MTVFFIIIAAFLSPQFLSNKVGAVILLACLFIDIVWASVLFAVDLGFRFREKPMNNPPSHGEIIFNELRGLYNDLADHISKTEKRSTLAQRAITLYNTGKVGEEETEMRIIMESVDNLKALEAFIKECTSKPNRNWFAAYNKAFALFGKMMFHNKELMEIWEKNCSYKFDIYNLPRHYWRDKNHVYHEITSAAETSDPINPKAFSAEKKMKLCNDGGKLAPSEQFALLTWRNFQVMERAIDQLLSQLEE